MLFRSNRIRYIDLACCNRLTDTSVQQLATLPKLRRIGLVKCQLISDDSILALARPKVSIGVSCLERVHLSYCVRLTMGVSGLLESVFQEDEQNADQRTGNPRFAQQLPSTHPPQSDWCARYTYRWTFDHHQQSFAM